MWPLACGATPMKFARSVASSVCGRLSCDQIAMMATSHRGDDDAQSDSLTDDFWMIRVVGWWRQ